MATVTEKPQILEHINKSIAWTVFDTRWIPSSARFVALGQYARGTGALQVYSLSHGQLTLDLEAEKKAGFKCGTFGTSSSAPGSAGRILTTGDFDGWAMQWDLERIDYPIYSVRAAPSIVNSIDGMSNPGAPEFVTGSRDGCVRVFDPRQPDRPVASLVPSDTQSSSSSSSGASAVRDCWAVAFGNGVSGEDRCVAAGYDNGDIKLFDLRMNALRWESNIGVGVCGIEFDRQSIAMNKMVVSGLSGHMRVFDLRTLHPDRGYASVAVKGTETGHGDSTIWCVRHLPQNRDVWMSCGGSGGLSLWNYSYPAERSKKDENGLSMGVAGTCKRLQNVSIGTQPVHCFDWSRDKEGLCVFGAFDQCIRVGIVTRLNKVY
eukprot:ANDGO_06097.mRNA.1 WD repeat-containing protein 92 homolog